MRKYVSKSIEDTANIAGEWLFGVTEVRPRSEVEPQATVIGLSGHLGAGKTAFVKCVAKILGIDQEVTSPTFVIMKIYDIDAKKADKNLNKKVPWKKLVHIDAYRLEKPEELSAINFEKVVSDPENLVLIEWPENVGIEKQYPNISFNIEGDGEGRVIQVK